MALRRFFRTHPIDPGVLIAENKRMVALMIEDVQAHAWDRDHRGVSLQRWLTRTLTVPIALNGWKKYMTARGCARRIDRLLDEHTDAETAKILNERGSFRDGE